MKLIKEKQPNGPYRLGGYSFGGALCVELARNLAQTNHKIESLTIIEGSPDYIKTRIKRFKTVLAVPEEITDHVYFLCYIVKQFIDIDFKEVCFQLDNENEKEHNEYV